MGESMKQDNEIRHVCPLKNEVGKFITQQTKCCCLLMWHSGGSNVGFDSHGGSPVTFSSTGNCSKKDNAEY